MTRIIMHGCNGHMGRVITDLVSKDDECKIVAGILFTPDRTAHNCPKELHAPPTTTIRPPARGISA